MGVSSQYYCIWITSPCLVALCQVSKMKKLLYVGVQYLVTGISMSLSVTKYYNCSVRIRVSLTLTLSGDEMRYSRRGIGDVLWEFRGGHSSFWVRWLTRGPLTLVSRVCLLRGSQFSSFRTAARAWSGVGSQTRNEMNDAECGWTFRVALINWSTPHFGSIRELAFERLLSFGWRLDYPLDRKDTTHIYTGVGRWLLDLRIPPPSGISHS